MEVLRLCAACGRAGADPHTLLCLRCHTALPDYQRRAVERHAIHVALLRQHLIEGDMGGVRWTEQQLRDHLRRAQEPAPKEERKAKAKPLKLKALEPRTLVFELELVPMRNAYDRMHFRAQRRLKDRLAATFHRQLPIGSGIPLERATVEIVRYSSQQPDEDGLVGSVKPVLDAMQVCSKRHPYGASIIVNDNPDCIALKVRWEKCPPKHGKVVVMVTPL